jgi:L-ascorbate metabolism protein UlaG (beta-lactamase superfamily)
MAFPDHSAHGPAGSEPGHGHDHGHDHDHDHDHHGLSPLVLPPKSPDPADAAPGARSADLAVGSITFVGTATTLIRCGGFTVLTDPNFLHRGERVHLGFGMTSQRLTEPAMDLSELPPVDLVVLSHMHEDHFDRVVEERLDHTLPILTTPSAAQELTGKGFGMARALPTWGTQTVRKRGGAETLSVTAMPGRHGPMLLTGLGLMPEVMGSMLDFVSGDGRRLTRLYITGDTLVFGKLREIAERYPEIDISLLHLGGTRMLGVLLTMDAQQGVEMMRTVPSRTAIPIHFDDYDVFKSPLDAFRREVERAGLEDRVRYLSRGETHIFETGVRSAAAAPSPSRTERPRLP